MYGWVENIIFSRQMDPVLCLRKIGRFFTIESKDHSAR